MLYRVVADLDPRYRESAEESLVETAQLMASLVEQDVRDGAIDTSRLEPLFKSVYARKFEAHIFSVTKRRVELRLYVTDRSGRVLFDSLGHVTGADFSQWRDIRMALRGEYGSRTTPDVENDPATSVMYVGAPVRWNNEVDRRGIGGQAGAELRPVRRGRAPQDALRRADVGGRRAAAGAHRFGLAGAALRPDRRLRALRAGAAPLQPAAPGPARAGGDRRRLRRNARRPGRPQLRRRLRADPHPRGQEPAVGHSRRGRTAAGARHAAGRARSASWPTSRAKRSASRRWSTA